MTGDELKSERLARSMTQAVFGAWLGLLLGGKPYAQPRVHHWERGLRPVPARIELALLKERLKDEEASGEAWPVKPPSLGPPA